MTIFNKQACRELRVAMENALAEVSEKFNIDIDVGNMRYSDFTCKIKVTAQSRDENAVPEAEKNYLQVMAQYQLPELFTVIEFGGEKYRIVGWKSRAKKYPIIGESLDNGKRYKLGLDYLKAATIISTPKSEEKPSEPQGQDVKHKRTKHKRTKHKKPAGKVIGQCYIAGGVRLEHIGKYLYANGEKCCYIGPYELSSKEYFFEWQKYKDIM